MWRAFITGSHAYGIPTEESDIDLVVLISQDDMRLLSDCHEGKGTVFLGTESDPGPNGKSLRFGKLNLICVTTPEAYDVWKEGTDQLKKKAPVTRDEAVDLFKQLREAAKNGVKS